MSEPLDGVQETLVFAYALCNLPIGDLTKHTCYRNGMPLFPEESRRVANYKFQNPKTAIRNNWKSAEKNIKLLDIRGSSGSFPAIYFFLPKILAGKSFLELEKLWW